MTSDGSSIDRLRGYLQSLSAEARAMLIVELERALLRDEEIVGGELLLQELRRTIRTAGQPAIRIGDAARRFFMPVEPFLIDGPADHRWLGRVARTALKPIWEWIGRDLMPTEALAFSEDIHRALLAEDRTKADQVLNALHDRAIHRMREAISKIGSGEKARRRFSIEVGTPRAVEDVATVARILSVRDVLAEWVNRLPDHIRAFERDHIDRVMRLLDGERSPRPPHRITIEKAELLLYGLIIVANRLAAPWQLIRIATHAAESDDAARIAGTPYAVAVEIVLGELEARIGELRGELKAGRTAASVLKALHDAARCLRTELDLSVDSDWSRQLAAIRSAVSNVLTAEVETAPGRVRRLLRPRPASEIAPGSLIDAIDLHEAASTVELVGVCRHYAGELAVSEVTMRTYTELSQYLEGGTRQLLDALRHAEDTERPFRQSQVDAAIRFCRTVFGAEYAGLLAKAADVAVQGSAVDRRAARA